MRTLSLAAAVFLCCAARARAGDDWSAALTAVPRPAVRALSSEQPADFDAERAAALAHEASAGSLGAFKGRCYEFAANAMERAGVISDPQWGELGIGPERAYMFADWADSHAETLRSALGLARIPTPAAAADFPVGAVVVYDRGQCGFSAASGHIEIVVRSGFACSDGCEILWPECFGSDADRARVHVYVPVAR